MNNVVKVIAVLAATCLLSAGVTAEEKAQSLDQLLKMVKQGKITESKEHREREARFLKEKANQQQLLKQAKQALADEEARSRQLEAIYELQKIAVVAKREQRQEQLGSLNELFGHLTTTAGDLRANLSTSLVSAQLPGRAKFLDELIEKMNSATQLPSIGEIEQLWYELQRETYEAGKVVKFRATVIKPDGQQAEQSVIRIGNYNLISEGRYLEYLPKGEKISELPRQPGGGYLSEAEDLSEATAGMTRVGIDPTGPFGGTYLSALINSPSLIERWHQGGLVGYLISAGGVFALLLAIWRLIALIGISARVKSQLNSETPRRDNPLGRVLAVAEQHKALDHEAMELKLEEAIIKERPAIESGLSLLKIISMVAPLMGLLGTVTGMIVTFQAITNFGAGDPKVMAGGISGALVTTVLGLCVAIPTVLMHTLVNSRAKSVLHVLEEQSAGIVAENAEKAG